jgi:hypothetical protein
LVEEIKEKKIIDALSEASGTVSALESCMLFAGLDHDCHGLSCSGGTGNFCILLALIMGFAEAITHRLKTTSCPKIADLRNGSNREGKKDYTYKIT